MRVLVLLGVAACSVSDPTPARPPPLAPLPPPAHVETDRFRDAEACGQCHLVDDTTQVLHDATGANDAPVLLWRSSLMALAARDPYYLAVFAEELARTTNKASVNATCTRCHGPAGSEESDRRADVRRHHRGQRRAGDPRAWRRDLHAVPPDRSDEPRRRVVVHRQVRRQLRPQDLRPLLRSDDEPDDADRQLHADAGRSHRVVGAVRDLSHRADRQHPRAGDVPRVAVLAVHAAAAVSELPRADRRRCQPRDLRADRELPVGARRAVAVRQARVRRRQLVRAVAARRRDRLVGRDHPGGRGHRERGARRRAPA